MTRRSWKTEDGWNVACGWDRPLQHFFLDIGKDCTKCEGEGTLEDDVDCVDCKGAGETWLFNNLTDKKYVGTVGGMKIEDVLDELVKYVTDFPATLIYDLLGDWRHNKGNLEKHYGNALGKVRA